ncbi:MAG: 23S rRNA (uracil(1939)-C(5))-methyltransferase RlmD [bacterium]|nr:23S rRNA (uracil(1939)-C(5))-methyltransferase RlmD [bacterium]
MKKGEIYTGIVESLDFPNKGVVRVDGQKVIVKNTIPGQQVEFRIQKKKSGRCEGQLLQVLAPAAEERTKDDARVCPHFGRCGGCQFQTLPYGAQLALKETQVKKLLLEVVKGELPFQGILGSPLETGYRNKMEFSFGDEVKDGPMALGMHKRGSFYDVVTTDQCNLVHPDFCRILTATKTYFEEMGTSFYKKMQHTGYLRHLLVRRAIKTGEILAALVTTTQTEEFDGQEEAVLTRWAELLQGLELEGTFAGILHIQNDSLADVVQSDCTKVLYGQEFFYEELLGLKFRISPFSFFQTNSLGAEVLYEKVREYIGDTRDKVVFDLYSGTGTIAQIAASVAKKVVGVEIVEEAVEAAKENAARNGISNCEFLAGDVLKVVGTLEDKPDLIVLDPPRDGIHPKALEKIIGFGVDRMVYVSCKPTSLARDLVVLQERGYQVEKVCCVDMFPATGNIETVVLLSKGEIDSKKVRVEFSLEDMDMSDFQDKATYSQIKEYVLEHSGLKVSSLYISQVKRKCGLDVGKNYNLAKAEDSRQPQCPPEKENAIREAFEYFGMI